MGKLALRWCRPDEQIWARPGYGPFADEGSKTESGIRGFR